MSKFARSRRSPVSLARLNPLRSGDLAAVFAANLFWIVYAIALTAFSFTLFFGWGLMVGTFFLIFATFRLTGLEGRLSPRDRRLYYLTLVLYPPLETLVQWLGVRGLIPSDFTWINRVEHAVWAAMLAILFLPLLQSIWQRLTLWQSALFLLGFVCLLGNLNEFFEYLTRLQYAQDAERFARYYSDTIYDMVMNLMGGGIGFGLYYTFASSASNRVFRS